MPTQNLSLSAKAQQILQRDFGYSQFRGGQTEVINTVLAGKDCLAVMATGAGKSLCYQIPALCLDGCCVVISPLISLMQDQVLALKSLGIEAEFLNSTQSIEQQREVKELLHQGKVKLLYLSPERLLIDDFHLLSSLKISFVAIDEAHCISQWGHDFRPEYSEIWRLKERFQLPFLALTATADKTTRSDIINKLTLKDPLIHIGSFDRPNISYNIIHKDKPSEQILAFLRNKKNNSGIIYCSSRKKVETVNAMLLRHGYNSMPYHAGMENSERERTLVAFSQDKVQIVVATVAFGMGIDKPNIRFVIHYDIPRSIEAYYQETGRAGRDGLPSVALMLYAATDTYWIASQIEENAQNKEIEKAKLYALDSYANAKCCRRLVLLNYFGQNTQDSCNNCDICCNPIQKYDGTIDAQKVLSAIYRSGQNFGQMHIIDILCGRKTIKITQNAHDKLSCFAVGSEQNPAYWRDIISQLIHLGYIVPDITRFNILKLTAQVGALFKGEISLKLVRPNTVKISHKKAIIQNSQQEQLFEILRELRQAQASKLKVIPYMIFNDKTLTELSINMPRNERQFLAINGVGEFKLQRFGKEYLDAINNFAKQNIN